MRKEIFVNTKKELEELKTQYNLEDCGMSGSYAGYHWLSDDVEEVDIYYKIG